MLKPLTFAKPSSAIARAAYHEEKQKLVVEMADKSRYVYHGVPVETVQQFESAPSAGKFYNQAIKPAFEFTKQGA